MYVSKNRGRGITPHRCPCQKEQRTTSRIGRSASAHSKPPSSSIPHHRISECSIATGRPSEILQENAVNRIVTFPSDHSTGSPTCSANLHRNPKLFPKLSRQSNLRTLPRIHLASGKFPQAPQMPLRRSPTSQHLPFAIADHATNHLNHLPIHLQQPPQQATLPPCKREPRRERSKISFTQKSPSPAPWAYTWKSCSSESLILTAPLAPNHNHLGTAFGGSLVTIATLAGYCALWTALGDRKIHIVVRRSSIEYLRPVTKEIRATCQIPAEEDLTRLRKTLVAHGKARLPLEVIISENSKECVQFTGEFVALQ